MFPLKKVSMTRLILAIAELVLLLTHMLNKCQRSRTPTRKAATITSSDAICVDAEPFVTIRRATRLYLYNETSSRNPTQTYASTSKTPTPVRGLPHVLAHPHIPHHLPLLYHHSGMCRQVLQQ